LQSHAGEISLLPALPNAWPTGSVTGLRARGGVEVDLNWQAGHLAAADIKPTIDGPQRVRLPTGSVAVEIRSSAKALPIDLDNEGALRLDMHAGDVYKIRVK
jgi:alpha-L-fucosidase 2